MAKLVLEIDGKDAERAAKAVERQLKKLGVKAEVTVDRFDKMSGAARKMGRTFALVGSAVAAIGLTKLAKDAIQAQISFERIGSALKVATGSLEGARREMEWVTDLSNELGLPLEKTATAFSKLAVAAKGTALEGQAVKSVFTSVAEAGTVLNMSSEQMSGALTALEQIISKGKVSAEELRGQLGERLPGAFQLAASAIGVTTAELDKMLSTGKLTAEELLPALAEELHKVYGPEVATAAQNTLSNFNRLQNAILLLKGAMGEELAPAIGRITATLAAMANDDGAREFFRELGRVIATLVDILAAVITGFDDLKAAILQFTAETSRVMANWMQKMAEQTHEAFRFFHELPDAMKKMVPGLAEAEAQWYGLTAVLVEARDELNEFADSAEQAAIDALNVDTATAKAAGSMSAFGGETDKAGDSAVDAAKRLEALAGVLERIHGRMQAVKDATAAVVGEIERLEEKPFDFKLPTTDEVFGEGTEEWLRGQEKAAKQAEEIWTSFSRSFQSTFSDAIYQTLDGNMDSFDDFFDSVLDMFKRMIAEMIAYAAINKIVLGIGFGQSMGMALGGGAAGGAGGGLLGGLFGAGSGAAFKAGLGGVSGGGMANAVGLGLAAAAPVLGMAVAYALVKTNIDHQNKKRTVGTIGFGEGPSASGFGGTVLGENQDALLATYHSLVDFFQALETLTGSTLDLTEQIKIDIKGHGKVWLTILDEMGNFVSEEQFDSLEAAMESGISRLMSTADFEGASLAISELMKMAITKGVEQTMADATLLAGFEGTLAGLQGFATLDTDQTLVQIEGLREAIAAMGLSAEAAAPFMERLADAEKDRIKTLQTDVLDKLFSYFEGTAMFERERMQLARTKVELEFKVIEAQLRAYELWDQATQKIFDVAKSLAIKASQAVQPVSIVEDLTAGEDAAWQAELERRRRRVDELKDLIKLLKGEFGKKGGKTPFQMMLADLIEEMKKYSEKNQQLFADYIELLKQQRGREIEGILLDYVKDDEKYSEQWRQWQEAKLRLEFELLKMDLQAIGMWEELAELWGDALNAGLDDLDKTIDNFADAISDFQRAIEALQDYRDSLLISDLSPLPLRQQLDLAQGAFQDLLQDALAGDAGAISALPGAADDLLRLARSLFGSGANYKSIFDMVLSSLDTVLGTSGSHVEPPDQNALYLGGKVDATTDAAKDTTFAVRDGAEMTAELLERLIAMQEKHAGHLSALDRNMRELKQEQSMANAIN